ncbi:unnamed protein product [Peronospora farinosa]|uniref:RNase H type-1 domain-containing protein n=1 Tax=Peronospora farinosa TaxID=134698 RepID=A0AAV0UAJ4_9STRA|nr:unnamed protein product [Peronospora farinosa]
MACKDSSYFAVSAARDSSLCSPLLPESRSEVAPTPTGPLSAAVLAITADASSATVTAGAANTQSIVPAAPASAGHHPDLDVVMQVTDGVMDQASAQAASLPNTPRPSSQCATAQQTRWGPRLLTDDATAPTLAVRRPLTPAASGTGATRWGPCHRAIGAAAVAHLVTGEPTIPAPSTRPSSLPAPRRTLTRWGPRVLVRMPSSGRRLGTRGTPSLTSSSAAVSSEAASAHPPALPRPSPSAPSLTRAVEVPSEDHEPWLLRFDGACRRNPGPGGAGAVLFDSGGTVVWTCSHFLPSSSETNNTAEYTALLLGLRSAVQHGATRLLVEGDSNLVLAQVRGSFSCNNRRLRRLRNSVRQELRRLEWHKLRHVDRQANSQADRLANRSLDLQRTAVECGHHSGDMLGCFQPNTPPATDLPAPVNTGATSVFSDESGVDDDTMEVEAEIAARDGEVFPTLPIGPGSAPARQPRLRLRQLTEEERDAAADALQTFADGMASRITDADCWATGEGYISAIPDRIREVLLQFSNAPPPASASPAPSTTQASSRRRRPPRVTRSQREHRLDEALDDLQTTQQASPADQRAVRKARRRVGRIRSSMAQQQLRRDFAQDEAKCVTKLLADASVDTAGEEHPDTCPIDREEMHRYFTGTCTERVPFDYDAPQGQEFRAALDVYTPALLEADALDEELSMDEVEYQLSRATKTSSPGHDGIGYDVYSRFAAQLVPLLHTAFQFCWMHRRVPSLWKVGIVRLIHKKGDPEKPENWRPICLLPTVYKLYSGLLARRLSRWMEGNDRLPMAQKGFRAFNGCHEHNFLATTMLGRQRALSRLPIRPPEAHHEMHW